MRPVRFPVAYRNEWPVSAWLCEPGGAGPGAARERRSGRKVRTAAGNFPSTFPSSVSLDFSVRAGPSPASSSGERMSAAPEPAVAFFKPEPRASWVS